MTRTDLLANALGAMGCSRPRSHAVLMIEVWNEILEDEMALAGAHLAAVRGERYGTPEDNFGRIWHLWQPILEADHLTGGQRVNLCMLAVKLARLIETPDDPDSIADIAGYAATLDMLAGREPSV